MLLPQLHDELTRAAYAAQTARRIGARTASALTAALLVLLLGAPTAQGQLQAIASAIATTQLRGIL